MNCTPCLWDTPGTYFVDKFVDQNRRCLEFDRRPTHGTPLVLRQPLRNTALAERVTARQRNGRHEQFRAYGALEPGVGVVAPLDLIPQACQQIVHC